MQICFALSHVNKCKNRYNLAFVPLRNEGRGGFNENFKCGQRQNGRGFGNNGGNGGNRFFSGGYGRGYNCQFGNNFSNSQFGISNMQIGRRYQGHIMYSNPSAFYAFNSVNYFSTYPPAPPFGFHGDYSGYPTPSALLASILEMIKDLLWYNDIIMVQVNFLNQKFILEHKSYLLEMVLHYILNILDQYCLQPPHMNP